VTVDVDAVVSMCLTFAVYRMQSWRKTSMLPLQNVSRNSAQHAKVNLCLLVLFKIMYRFDAVYC